MNCGDYNWFVASASPVLDYEENIICFTDSSNIEAEKMQD
jgi:hypothetical protein